MPELTMNKHIMFWSGHLLFAVFLTIVTGCFSYPAPVPNTAAEPVVLVNSGPPSEWAEIHVTRGMTLLSLDGQRANWGPGTKNYVSPGPHTLDAVPEGKGWSAVSLTADLLPGRVYLLKMRITDSDYYTDSRRTRSSASAEIELAGRGFTEYAVPTGDESIVEFTLNSTLVLLNVDGRDYELYSGDIYAGGKLRLFLSPGTHRVGSNVFHVEKQIDVRPNRFISYSIGTDSVELIKSGDRPLGLTGKWVIDAFGDKSVVLHYTFSPNMTGYSTTFSNEVLYSSGGFNYEITGDRLTMQDLGGSRSMEYALSADGKILTLYDFLGEPITVRGIRQ
jgi:hypothetical protein